MACERYRDTLSDVAAGAATPPGVGAHLAACAACCAELAALQQALAVVDSELARLRLDEPSVELAVRIRSAVAEPAATPAWRLGWLWPSLVAAAMLVLSVIGISRAPSPGPAVAVATAPPSSAGIASPTAPASGAVAPEPAPGPARGRATVAVRLPRDAFGIEPEVLVPPGEAEALLRFVALVQRARLAPAALSAAGQPSADLAELRPIDIQPLEIVPLDPAETSGP